MSQTLFVVYDTPRGEILRRGACHSSVISLQAGMGQSVLVIDRGVEASDSTHYVDLTGPMPILTARPAAPSCALSAAEVVADGEAEIVLTGVPTGAVVTIGLTSITADGDDIVITTDIPGNNRVSVDAFPAQLWTETFIGTAS